MDYKKILSNPILVFIDKVFRFFGYCFEIQVNMDTKKITKCKLRKSYGI